MISPEGKVFKVYGQVIKVEPPKRVGFTWGWHDDADQRGVEIYVTFTNEQTPKGAILTNPGAPGHVQDSQHRRRG